VERFYFEIVKEEERMKIYQILSISGMALCICLLCTTPACAYLDPATGSMIVQAVIAFVAAAGVSVGIFWKRLKSFFGRNKEDDPGDK
jgi:Na+/melibiose symporter-like transporter